MIVMVCVSNNGGMMFNHRRQSRDRVLQKHILNLVGSNKLWMNTYSKKLFANVDSVIVDEEYLDKAQTGDYCFVEDKDISAYLDKIEQIIVFKWNRDYHADFFLTVDLSEWNKVESEDFEGNSHPEITKEIYVK